MVMRARRRNQRALARYNEGPASPVPFLLGGAAVLGILGLALKNRGSIVGIAGQVFDFAKGQAFQAALPTNVGKWASQILRAAQKYNVDPWVLAGIMYRETLGGDAFTDPRSPKGAAGHGDFIPRPQGRKYRQPDGTFYTVGPTGLPEDGLGWGRGLMSVDYGVHYNWFKSGANWRDPQVSIDKGAELLKEKLAYFQLPGDPKGVSIECWRLTKGMPEYKIAPWPQKYSTPLLTQAAASPCATPSGSTIARTTRLFPDPRPLSGTKLYEAAVAAYNAGFAGPLQAMALGLSPEACTTGQDYVSWFTTRVAAWMARFKP